MTEEMGNQTQEVVETIEQPIEQTQETVEQPSSPQESPQAFRVKYNKEEVEVPYDQAPDYIQKGMNYDKVSQRADEYQQHLDRVARITGYESHDQLLQAMEEAEQEQERAKYEQAGIDPDQFQKLISELPEIQQFREIQKQQEESQQLQTEYNELAEEFPDVTPENIPAEVWQMKKQRDISLMDAYLRVNYKSLGQQKEQEAIQKLQQNQLSSTGSLGDGEVKHTGSVNSLSSKDFGSLVDQVLRGERKQL